MLTKLPAHKSTGSESPEAKTISPDGRKGQVQTWFQILLEQKPTGATSPCLQWDLWQSAQASALPAHVHAHRVFRTHGHPSHAALWHTDNDVAMVDPCPSLHVVLTMGLLWRTQALSCICPQLRPSHTSGPLGCIHIAILYPVLSPGL